MSVISDFIAKPSVQRGFWTLLRSYSPVVVFGKKVFITSYGSVIETLKRDTDFTIAEINGKRMSDIGLAFFLGMDRGEQHDRELALMQQVVKREDLNLIQNFVKQKSQELIRNVQKKKKIDVVNEYARIVPLYLLETYFGVPVGDENKMKQWMRILFHHLFLNLTNDPTIQKEASKAADELKAYMDKLIQDRKQKLLNGDQLDDTILNRLLIFQKDASWISDDVIRRNVCGFIIGAVDTTNKACALAMDVLLDDPESLKGAEQAAIANDIPLTGKYMLEALRFNPHNPIVIRYNKNASNITHKGKNYKVPEKATVYIGLLSAMWDKTAYKNPHQINLTRNVEYFHFSSGLHACAGKYINMVQIPELMAGLLRLKNLRRAPGKEGQIVFDGPFPDQFILEFEEVAM
jgi:cytochrome P450